MAYGVRQLSKIQLGREATAGTPVAATEIYRAPMAFIIPEDTVTAFEENVSIYGGADRSAITQLGAGLAIPSHAATFRQVPHLYEMTIETESPVADGTGSDYIYVYNAPTTAAPSPKYYTIEAGDNQKVWEVEYTFGRSITWEYTMGGAVMVSADLFGRQLTDSAFTGALSVVADEELIALKSKLYWNAVSGSFGDTQKTGTFLGASITYESGLMPIFVGDGNKYFTAVKCVGPTITGSITVEHDAAGDALITDYQAQTPRIFRIETTGSDFATAGTTYSVHTHHLDFVAKITAISVDEQNGNNVVVAEIDSRYNATAATRFAARVVNERANLN